MEKVKNFNLQEFTQFTKKQFNKNLIVGSWLVWYDNSFYAEWIFHDSGRFEQQLQNTQQNIGNWIYLPDLQIINISFLEKNVESLNFYLWRSNPSDSILFCDYENDLKPLYLIKKTLFSPYDQQEATLLPLHTFAQQYNRRANIENMAEDDIVNQEVGLGCAIFGVLTLVAIKLNYGIFIVLIVLIVIYAARGEKRVRQRISSKRMNSHFINSKGFNLPEIDDKLSVYNNKKFLYGIIGFFFILLLALKEMS